MILEQFEIENWSCIRRLAVADLPAAGVVVLHGPNGTGKSSIVAALRATLFDFQPTSVHAKLKRFFPNWTGDAPRVTVGFRVGAASFRVSKQFKNGGDCRLEERRAGEWSVITRSPADVHDRTLALVGNKGSEKGLQQLLWLQQAEYRLPDKKDFDPDLQAQLRNILGVMQTPLDDAFVEKVKERWKSWYTARNQPGEKAKRSKTCGLEKDLERREHAVKRLAELDAEYRAIEQSLTRVDYLESEARRLQGDLDRCESDEAALRDESNRSQVRLKAFEVAHDQVVRARADVKRAKERLNEQAAAAARLTTARAAVTDAQSRAEHAARALAEAGQKCDEIRQQIARVREDERAARDDLRAVEAHERLILKQAALAPRRERWLRAEELHRELQGLKQLDLDRPAPTQKALNELVANRAKADRLRAELDAAAMSMTVTPEPGAAAAALSVDGADAFAVNAPVRRPIRRRAELVIPGWGTVEVARGSDAHGLDDIERDLDSLDRAFRDGVAPFGLSGREHDALEQLRRAAADRDNRAANRKRVGGEIQRMGADDLDAERSEFRRLETGLETAAAELADAPPVANPSERAKVLNERLAELKARRDGFDAAMDEAGRKIEEKPGGLRARADQALSASAAAEATARTLSEELDRLPAPEVLAAALAEAERNLSVALTALSHSQLSDEESALPERLAAAVEKHKQLRKRQEDVREELHKLQGALSKSAGLHQDRADAAAVVDGLTRKTDREVLESRAYDRLYELFEECRQKQLTSVAGPVTDRVLRWMRLTGITHYGALDCGDNFLPHTLAGRDGRQSLPLDHESTGTREQVALMVRLALGSVLAPPHESAVAVLDDPLTHSDSLRLDRMRAVLKAAAAGDPSTSPPAGPLQILVFTCHPEWFLVDPATMMDLGNPAILDRA